MKIICDKCNKKFEHTKIKLKETKITDNITQIYYKCPKCKFKHVVGYKDNEIRENIKRIKKLSSEALNDDKEVLKKIRNLKLLYLKLMVRK